MTGAAGAVGTRGVAAAQAAATQDARQIEPARSRNPAAADTVSSAQGMTPPAGLADHAFEVLLAQDAALADANLSNAADSMRIAVERRIEAREEIRRLMAKIAEANRERGFFSKLVSGLGWLGKALGAVAAIAAIASLGGGVVIGLGVAAAAVGGASALSRVGVGAAERDALRGQAAKIGQDGVVSDSQTAGDQAQAFASAVVQMESAMRQRALAIVQAEADGLRTAASAVRRNVG